MGTLLTEFAMCRSRFYVKSVKDECYTQFGEKRPKRLVKCTARGNYPSSLECGDAKFLWCQKWYFATNSKTLYMHFGVETFEIFQIVIISHIFVSFYVSLQYTAYLENVHVQWAF